MNPFIHKVLKVGITGGIGSGKTTACKLFEKLGIPVYYADERGKYLMQHEHHLIDEIKNIFGKDAYENGILNRKLIADVVFQDSAKLELLNALVHPAVYHDMECWLLEKGKQSFAYVLKEAALLVETGAYKTLDKLIVVTAPFDIRVKRVKERDSLSNEDILARMRNQLPEDQKVKLADYVIANNSDLDYLEQQVRFIHNSILSL